MSSPASQLVASIRSALSLRSIGSGSHHSSRSRTRGGVVNVADGHADDSQVRIHATTTGQRSEWHRLGESDSQKTSADAPRVSDETDYDAKSANGHGSMV